MRRFCKCTRVNDEKILRVLVPNSTGPIFWILGNIPVELGTESRFLIGAEVKVLNQSYS